MSTLVALPQSTRVPRDGYDRPLIVPRKGGKPVAHTRTTTFIDCIEDKSNLATYGQRMVLAGAACSPSLVTAAEGLDPQDPDDKKKLNALAERALEAAGGNVKRDAGSHLHELSEYVDRGEELPLATEYGDTTEQDVEDMAAYKFATLDFSFTSIERLVVCNLLNVAGTPDRVGLYTGPGPILKKGADPVCFFDNEPLITDLKTGTIEYGALKMGAQLGIYSRGEFYDPSLFPVKPLPNDPDGKKALAAWKKVVYKTADAEKAYSSIGEVNQEWGVIFNLRPGSGECTLHWVNLTEGWKNARLAKTIRAARSKKQPLIPFRQ